ncbi:MAG: deoxyribose-phosphate aldolase [Bryobacteraceae bacterium]|nr:deoxyribose-phosphate aldolase [Bryobacteraceae bacterium]
MDDVRPPLTTYEQLAKMIDHSLLRPELDEARVIDGCKLAVEYNVANVTVRPSDADLAVTLTKDTGVVVGSVVGFPHGSHTTPVKLYEARDLLRRGVKEIDMVLNIGKLLSRQFKYVESELFQMADACHEQGAILKVIFENAYLTEELKIIACKISKRAGVDFTKTSTGFAPSGATLEDLRLMYEHCAPNVQVKAAGGVRDLDKAIQVYEAGCSRFGATATAAILDAWKQRLAAAAHAS